MIVEQPRRKGWTLDSDPKPEEMTESLYRFRVGTAPRETVRLHIGERHTRTTRYAVANFDEQQMTAMLRQTGMRARHWQRCNRCSSQAQGC